MAYSKHAPVAQWTEHLTSDQNVVGSNPAGGAISGNFLGEQDSIQKPVSDSEFFQSHKILITTSLTLCSLTHASYSVSLEDRLTGFMDLMDFKA